MKTIKGPGIFLAQFAGDAAPFDTLENLSRWAAGLGFVGVQIPSWDKRLFDLERAAESQEYCDEILGTVRAAGLEVTELSTHLQGQLVASHPAYDTLLEGFAPAGLDAKSRQSWAVAAVALGCEGKLAHGPQGPRYIFRRAGVAVFLSVPQRPAGLIDEAFAELGRRWLPILNAFDEVGVDACFELHPGEDLHDGATFERFSRRCRKPSSREHPL